MFVSHLQEIYVQTFRIAPELTSHNIIAPCPGTVVGEKFSSNSALPPTQTLPALKATKAKSTTSSGRKAWRWSLSCGNISLAQSQNMQLLQATFQLNHLYVKLFEPSVLADKEPASPTTFPQQRAHQPALSTMSPS